MSHPDVEGARPARMSKDILGNHVETDVRVLEGSRSSEAFRGTVEIVPGDHGIDQGRRAADVCAPHAIAVDAEGISLDLGKCIMCGRCQESAPEAFRTVRESAPPVRNRADLLVAGIPPSTSLGQIGTELRAEIERLLGRSLAIREVDAGSCNGCEVEVSALSNPIYDVERFGIHFVASPRHADVLLVTGVASLNLETALRRTFEATPDPKVVVAVGACACSGGIFADTYASAGGIGGVVPVDVFVPGCPPRPEAILYGILLAVGRVKPRET